MPTGISMELVYTENLHSAIYMDRLQIACATSVRHFPTSRHFLQK